MSDILVRDLPESVVAEIDAQAARLGLSRAEYVRRQLIREARRTSRKVSSNDLRKSDQLLANLLDQELMKQAWK